MHLKQTMLIICQEVLNSKTGNSPSSNKDIEEIILAKLSEEMGTSSLDKVIKMNRDVRLSKDTTNDWKRYLNKQSKSTDLVEMELKICNVTDWPKSMTKDYKWFSRTEMKRPIQMATSIT